MVITSLPKTTEKSSFPVVTSRYSFAKYKQDSYELNYAKQLVRTGKNYHVSKSEIPEGYRMSTAGEELAIQLALERAGKDPRKAEIFDNLFARGPENIYMWQWTETGLRVPKGREADRYVTDGQGRKYWPRIVLLADKEVGEILVPEGNDSLVAEWDEVFGVPQVTIENQNFPHKPYTTHFLFNATPEKDSISGHHDVAVGRRSDWRHGGHVRCLGVYARYGRLAAGSADGFRLVVRGIVTEIEKEFAGINSKDVEQAFLEIMRNDYRKMPFTEFQKKYKL